MFAVKKDFRLRGLNLTLVRGHVGTAGRLDSIKLGKEEAVWAAGVGRVPGQSFFDIPSS